MARDLQAMVVRLRPRAGCTGCDLPPRQGEVAVDKVDAGVVTVHRAARKQPGAGHEYEREDMVQYMNDARARVTFNRPEGV